MPRPAALAAVAATLVAGCGEQAGPRDHVNAYIRESNSVQRKAGPALARANEAYAAFARGELADPASVQRLDAAEQSVRKARDALAGLEPPPEARRLHSRLLRVYDMSLDFAHQTALMGSYGLASGKALERLTPAGRRLDRGLARPDAGVQQRALRRFAKELGRASRRLERLEPPLVLKVGHDDQLLRLRATRELALDLRKALIARDSKRVALLLRRFRRADRVRKPRRRLAARAVREYNRRYDLLGDAFADVRREQADLNRTVP